MYVRRSCRAVPASNPACWCSSWWHDAPRALTHPRAHLPQFKTDLEILTGRAPFEFRVETAPIDDTTLLKLVCQSWREIVSA